jgi:hypothetical protein
MAQPTERKEFGQAHGHTCRKVSLRFAKYQYIILSLSPFSGPRKKEVDICVTTARLLQAPASSSFLITTLQLGGLTREASNERFYTAVISLTHIRRWFIH